MVGQDFENLGISRVLLGTQAILTELGIGFPDFRVTARLTSPSRPLRETSLWFCSFTSAVDWSQNEDMGMGREIYHPGTAGFSRWFHLPGFHFGHLCLTHTHI